MFAKALPRVKEIYGNSPRHVFLTINCWERIPALASASFAERVRDQLLLSAKQFKVEVSTYTVMPDHVHVLVRVTPNDDIWECMRRWKQRTGYWWKQEGNGHPLWQRGYHDRVLRLDESPEAFALYIIMNPVREGLVLRPEDYPWSGCPGFDMKQLAQHSPVDAGL